MSDVAEGDCEWPEPHPPHLWGDTLTFPDGGSEVKIWACSGTVEDDI